MNGRLLEIEALLLTRAPRLVSLPALREMMACGLDAVSAYGQLLSAACGLRPDESDNDRQLLYEYLLPSIQCLDSGQFASNPYYSSVRVPELQEGNVRLTHCCYEACEAFPCGDLQMDAGGRLRAPLGFMLSAFHYPAIFQHNHEWMSLKPNEIITMQPAIDAARGHLLVYGLGMGYFPYMASGKKEVLSVTVVEREASVIDLFRRHLLPQFPHRDKITILQSDAFLHAETTRFRLPERFTEPVRTKSERIGGHNCPVTHSEAGTDIPYDTVFTDLWHDASDGIPLYSRMRALQRRYAHPATRFLYWIEPTLKYYLKT